MSITLNWTDNNDDETGFRIYRSETPINLAALPAPLVELPAETFSYVDTTAEFLKPYHYVISTLRGAEEVFSQPIYPYGLPYGGGFYAGNFMLNGELYALIVAPKSAEAASGVKWTTDATIVSPNVSSIDGFSNTEIINDAQHPLAQHCRNYNGGGYTDWYLPATNELEIIYRNLKPTSATNTTTSSNGLNNDSVPAGAAYTDSVPGRTKASAFATGGNEAFNPAYNYLTSTMYTTTSSYCRSINFGNGQLSTASLSVAVITNNVQGRPVRRVKLT